jgi:Ca2+-binding EF-hand superfamily protein
MPGQTPDTNAQPGGVDPSEAIFRKLDLNGDGVLNTDEMPDDLKAVKDQYANRDGVVDLNAFKQFMSSKAQQGPGGNMPWWQEETPEEEEKRPVVYHADNLPKELVAGGKASWFQELDKDNDAQIALYEWKDSGRSIEEFQKMDRNGDGYLTVEEVLYYLAQQDRAAAKLKGKSGNAASASAGPGGPGGFRPGGGPPGQPLIGTPPADASPPGGDQNFQNGGGPGGKEGRRGGGGRRGGQGRPGG